MRLRGRWLVEASWLGWPLVTLAGPPDRQAADPEAPARIVTSILRLSPAHAEALGRLTSMIRADASDHYVYRPSSMHLTLLGATGSDRMRDELGRDLAAAARALSDPPVEIAIVGIAIGPDTVFAVLEPSDDRLLRVRRELEGQWGMRHDRGRRRWPVGGLFHANIVRWAATPDRRLVSSLRAHRGARWPALPLGAIELVETNKVLAAARTTTLGSFPLVGSRPGADEPGADGHRPDHRPQPGG